MVAKTGTERPRARRYDYIITTVHDSPAAPTEPLDEYSRVVSTVARRLLRSVASLAVARRGRETGSGGSGSAVVIAPDGLMLTAAHVVAAGDRGLGFVRRRSRQPVRRRRPRPAVGPRGRARRRARWRAARARDVGRRRPTAGRPAGRRGRKSARVRGLGRRRASSAGSGDRCPHARASTPVSSTTSSRPMPRCTRATRVAPSPTRTPTWSASTRAVAGPGFGQGLGLAVPINAFTQTIVAQLIVARTRAPRAFLGVAGGTRPLPPRSAAAVGHTHGFEVITVTPGSPADRAGIRVEDVLVEIDGVPVRDAGDLQALMVEQRIGTAIAVTLVRNGASRTRRRRSRRAPDALTPRRSVASALQFGRDRVAEQLGRVLPGDAARRRRRARPGRASWRTSIACVSGHDESACG